VCVLAPSQEDEDALQKEKASILNRIKKKLHIKKDESEDTTSPKIERRAPPPELPLSQSPSSRSKAQITSPPLSDDDMKLYDDSDDETSRYVPSVPDILFSFPSPHSHPFALISLSLLHAPPHHSAPHQLHKRFIICMHHLKP
jgi:hypothetical protein